MGRRGSGEGSIYQRKDGRWVGVADLGYIEGRRRRKSYYGATRASVQKKLASAIRELSRGRLPVDDRLTVGDYLQRWLDATRANVRHRTWIRYEQYVRLHTSAITEVPIAHLRPEHLQQLYASRLSAGASPSSVVHLRAVLHRALKQAERWDLVPRNVVALTDGPRVARKEVRTLSAQEARTLLDAARGDRLEALYVVALTSGLRQGELLGLQWSDIDLAAGTLQVRRSLERNEWGGLATSETKTARSRRMVPLTVRAVAALRAHRIRQDEERLRAGESWDVSDLVFATQLGKPLDPSNLIRRSFRPLLQAARLERIRFHDLRHTVATLLLEQGIHPKVVADLLGHSQVAITLDVYGHVLPGLQRTTAQAFDRLLAPDDRAS